MLLREPRIVVIDEPTRGIDIGTKEQIYRLVAELAAAGTAVVVISSEMAELIGLCHRILVMREGRIAGEGRWRVDDRAAHRRARHRGRPGRGGADYGRDKA